MIINSHIKKNGPSRITASVIGNPDFILNSGLPAPLNFNFSNPYSDSTATLVYNNGEMVDIYEFSPSTSLIELEEVRLGIEPGLKNIRIVFVNIDADATKIDYRILHGYNSINFSEYVYDTNTDSYILRRYTGSETTVLLPQYYIGEQGLRNLTVIGMSAFMNNAAFEVIIPETVTTIEESAFKGSGLVQITIPESVQKIKGGAFLNCNQLVTVTVLSPTPPILLGDNIFDSVYQSVIKVPEESVNLYKTAEKWSEYADRIFPI